MLAQGLPAEFLNKNFTVSEQIFRPLDGVEVEFDAIYNARFVPEKRHELAALVPRVAYVTYVDGVRRSGRTIQGDPPRQSLRAPRPTRCSTQIAGWVSRSG